MAKRKHLTASEIAKTDKIPRGVESVREQEITFRDPVTGQMRTQVVFIKKMQNKFTDRFSITYPSDKEESNIIDDVALGDVPVSDED